MGAINYKAGKYITIGYNAENARDEIYKELGIDENVYNEEAEQTFYDEENSEYDFFHDLLENSDISDYDFFNVKLELGYYSGFYIDISDLQYLYFDDEEEQKEAIEQAGKIRDLLLKAVECELVQCFPGWCNGWEENEENIKENIEKAYKSMISDIKKLGFEMSF